MSSNCISKSRNHNYYFFNETISQLFLIPEELNYFIKNNKGKQTPNSNYVKDQEYYRKKAKFWEKCGLLESSSRKKLISEPYFQSIKERLQNCRQIIFELTDSCNMNCMYCGQSQLYNTDYKTNKRLKFTDCKPLIDYMFSEWGKLPKWKHDIKRSISFYGGEPLLCFYTIKKVVDYIKNKNNGVSYTFSMTTNGLLLHKYIDFLNNNDFRITVSLDGNSNHNAFRVDHNNVQTYDKVINNLEFIKKNYKDFYNKNIFFSSVYNKNSDIDEITSFFKANFNRMTSISAMKDVNIAESKREYFNTLYKNPYSDLDLKDCTIIREKRIADKKTTLGTIVKYATMYQQHSLFELLFSVRKVKRPTGTCLPFEKKIVLTSNKKIQHCEKFHHKLNLGEIKNNKLVLYDNIEERYNHTLNNQVKYCNTCYFNVMCSKCIFILDNTTKKNTCEYYLDKEEFPIFLSDHISYYEN